MAGLPIWYELMTPDPAAVAPFYRDTLGWDIPASGMSLPNGTAYAMIGRSDGGNAGGVLTLTPEMTAHGARPVWLTYFHVTDVDAALAQAVAAGAAVHMPATNLPAGRMAMLADPQGVPFYIMRPVPPPGQPDAVSDVFAPASPGHCAWNELNTDDAEGQIAFYTGLLGWTVSGSMPMPGDHIYQFLECEGAGIGAIGSMKPEGMGNGWLPYFRVADIAAAEAAARAQGADVVMGPHEVPGDDVIIVVNDPAGAPLGLVGRKG